MITDKNLRKVVEEFSQPREELGGKSFIANRHEWFEKQMENVRPLLRKDALDRLSVEDARRIYDEIYDEMSVGGPKLYPKTYIENGLEKIKTALRYLLYGDDPVAERFYNFAGDPESEYRLNGLGKAFASTALHLTDPNRFAIWNGAVDGGLKLLGMLPKRRRGEHIGETYGKITEALKELQAKCRFEDLSIVDEFLQLIYHEKIGVGIIEGPDIPEPPEGTPSSEQTDDYHLHNQYLLAKIGRMRNYDVWVAANDRGKSYQGENLNDLTLDELPQFAGPTVRRIARSIDVIWFKKHTAQPVCFFEIEHSTAIYSGLLRLNDVKIDYPIPQAFIVGPKERKKLFERQIERRTFMYSELSDVCQFLTYEDVNKLWKSYEQIIKILL
jgi:hypothetical protein